MKLINDKEVDCGFCENGITPQLIDSCKTCNESIGSCPVCGEIMFKTPLGIRCKNGHENEILND